MPRAFASISFTPSVKAAQTLYRSREANQGFELADDLRNEITQREADFIEARDSFYQATVNEDGWPYVQHRGGPAGFLKVIDEHTIGFADFSGNRQYLSVGNLFANDRISIILMDYKEKRRLKIWGRVQIVHESEAPDVIAMLEMPSYRARIERAFIIRVEAWDWNCPQHITARFTDADIEQLMAPLQAELSALQKANREAKTPQRLERLGHGELELVISGVRQLTPEIRAYELRAVDGSDLPAVTPGAHLALPVMLPNGEAAVRHYSIASNPDRRDIYEVAVLQQAEGKGGSQFVHEHYQLGLRLRCDLPRNYFLREQKLPTVAPSNKSLLIAGGIGITAIKPLAQKLQAQGRNFSMHYAAKSRQHMAFGDRLRRALGARLQCYFGDQGQRMDLNALIGEAGSESDIFVCGPSAMIEEVRSIAARLGIAESRVHFERFSAEALSAQKEKSFAVHLKRSQKTIMIAPDQTILQALEAAQVPVASSCGTGQCGTCRVTLLAGEADHRDSVLSPEEKTQEAQFCPCVSRAFSDTLTLDI
ncbi:MAG: 2Fe-2S iron-sulfur cluster binding domain-containing protein [Burkholderiaceae bacterium]|nr:MAG: 2Fe-2S iron-sulfur cluster binding domain-containing protein [Burkholderiaceae bacterium]